MGVVGDGGVVLVFWLELWGLCIMMSFLDWNLFHIKVLENLHPIWMAGEPSFPRKIFRFRQQHRLFSTWSCAGFFEYDAIRSMDPSVSIAAPCLPTTRKPFTYLHTSFFHVCRTDRLWGLKRLACLTHWRAYSQNPPRSCCITRVWPSFRCFFVASTTKFQQPAAVAIVVCTSRSSLSRVCCSVSG